MCQQDFIRTERIDCTSLNGAMPLGFADLKSDSVLIKDFGVKIYRCRGISEIKKVVAEIFSAVKLPDNRDALILIKPNLNSDMIGITGNTTDLRLISSIVEHLKELGFSNIVVADGTSSGFINAGINVIARLRLEKMGEKLGFSVLDLNRAPYKMVWIGSEKLKLAKICLDCDFFINLPKLKTHAEAGMSVCMKSLLGCVVGLDKQKMHNNLPKNIWLLAKEIQPQIHIIDALFAMEGTGPSRGLPKRLDTIISGSDPFLIDAFCARLVGFDISSIPYLRVAEQNSKEVSKKTERVQSISLESLSFARPTPGFLFKLVNNRSYRKFFVRLRYAPLLHHLLSSDLLSVPLYSMKIRQDMFMKKDAKITRVKYVNSSCGNCFLCSEVCPMTIDIPNRLNTSDRCIHCLYCYFVCPKGNIDVVGSFGHFKYQLDKYQGLVQKVAKKVPHEVKF